MELEVLGGAGRSWEELGAGSWELGGVGRCWEELGAGSWELGGAVEELCGGTVDI